MAQYRIFEVTHGATEDGRQILRLHGCDGEVHADVLYDVDVGQGLEIQGTALVGIELLKQVCDRSCGEQALGTFDVQCDVQLPPGGWPRYWEGPGLDRTS